MAEDADAYLEAASQLLGLPIRAEYYAEIRAAFISLRAQAAMIAEFSLPEDAEAAPRFTP